MDATSNVEFHVSGHSLKLVSSVKLLGVQIDERLSSDDHWPLLLTWFNFNPSMDK